MKWFQKWLSKREPWVFENSKVPEWVGKISPIDPWAISAGPFVWCKGNISKTTLRHETIHYHQQIEMLYVFQWLLYASFWLIGLLKYRDGKKAYRENPFEREAYDNAKKYTYLDKRPLWNWVRYVKD